MDYTHPTKNKQDSENEIKINTIEVTPLYNYLYLYIFNSTSIKKISMKKKLIKKKYFP